MQDLVEVLSQKGIWKAPNKIDQSAYSRYKDGTFTGFEDDPPLVYHDGYLSSHFAYLASHFALNKYQEIDLTPLQQEAIR
jgi:hypothetical protein